MGKWLVVCALVASTGGHWLALQSVAWVSMAYNYAQFDSLPVALQKTFDGSKPCRLCKVVAEGRQAEQKQATLKVETKLELFCVHLPAMLLPPLPVKQATPLGDFFFSRTYSPPVPPPRAA